MRLVLCTLSSVYSHQVIKRLSQGTCFGDETIEIAGIVDSGRILHARESRSLAGLRLAARTGLPYALYMARATSPFARFGALPPWQTAQQWSRNLGAFYHHTNDINDASSQRFIQAVAPDLILCFHFNQIVHAPALDSPWPWWNIHPGRLPDYRGVDPAFFALLAGEEALWVSLHRLTPGIDEGPIIGEARLENQFAGLLSANCALFERGADLVLGNLGSPDEAQPQTSARPERYDSWPTAHQVSRFRAKGLALLG